MHLPPILVVRHLAPQLFTEADPLPNILYFLKTYTVIEQLTYFNKKKKGNNKTTVHDLQLY